MHARARRAGHTDVPGDIFAGAKMHARARRAGHMDVPGDIFAGAKMRAPRPQGEGQDGPSQTAKRTAVQTATLDTGRGHHYNQQVTCARERTGETSELTVSGESAVQVPASRIL